MATASSRANRQPVLIPAGTPITCEKGHRVCRTAVDLHVNELLAVEMFTALADRGAARRRHVPQVWDLRWRSSSREPGWRDPTHARWLALTDA
jgi:hypothetical protein